MILYDAVKKEVINLVPINVQDVVPASGGTGTDNYNTLTHKPSINDITLVGNKTLAELGIMPLNGSLAMTGPLRVTVIRTSDGQPLLTPGSGYTQVGTPTRKSIIAGDSVEGATVSYGTGDANGQQIYTARTLVAGDGVTITKDSATGINTISAVAGQSTSNVIIKKSIHANNWVSDDTYNDFAYKCVIDMDDVTENTVAEVIFAIEQAQSGNYASVCLTGDKTLTIYSKVNTSITIPTIILIGA